MGLGPGVYHLVVYSLQCVPIGMDLIEEAVHIPRGSLVHSLLALHKARVHQIGLYNNKMQSFSVEPHARAADRGDNQIIHHVRRLGVATSGAKFANMWIVATGSIANRRRVYMCVLAVATILTVDDIWRRNLQM